MISCNIDMFIAGCSTKCKHCYVDGGPEKSTDIDNINYAMKRLEVLLPLIEAMNIEVSVTLDNEPVNHKDAIKIYNLTKKHLGDYYFHHASTTGIPLLRHKDKASLTDTMIKHGYGQVGLTLHGNHDNHNEIVGNPDGLTSLIEAGKYLYQNNFHVVVSFMLSKLLIRDRDEIGQILEELPHHGIYFAITNASPIDRMQDYQKYRVSSNDVHKLKGYLGKWGFDEEEIFNRLEVCHEDYYIDELQKLPSWDYLKGSGSNIYMSLDADLNFNYGNTGLEVFTIGNLKSLSDQEIITSIKNLKPNDCYWDSYFRKETLPDLKDFIRRVDEVRTDNYIYPNIDSFLTYWFKRFNYDNE
ncbi:MAG: radical SAM protein [Clostridiales bacterium]|nr:radical SAM protein [Clostridiales bacterium]